MTSSEDIALSASGIGRSFGDKPVLSDLALQLPKGKISGLIGPSGSGKSVLLKILAGVDSHALGTVDRRDCRQDAISLMFQEGALFDSFTVFDNIAFPLVRGNVPVARLHKSLREEISEKVSDILGAVGLLAAAYKYPGQLSGGMRRRISMARALVTKPEIVLLDDPTAGLDPVASSVIMDLVVSMQKSYQPTVLMVSQDLRRLLPVCDHIFALADGKIEFEGSLMELHHGGSQSLHEFVRCRFDLDDYAQQRAQMH